jgi:methylated-DNA-[protein]-cysteine S-methyltransferase
MGKTFYTFLESPVGELLIAGDQEGVLEYLLFVNGRNLVGPHPDWEKSQLPFGPTIRQLRSYFDGELTRFDLALRPHGTPFQMAVWRALLEIPYGTTVSYAEIARRIGRPQAVRAVGAANGQNPLSIVIPCHRVIGSNGSLTGYGGGLSVKERLLALERSRKGEADGQLVFRMNG